MIGRVLVIGNNGYYFPIIYYEGYFNCKMKRHLEKKKLVTIMMLFEQDLG